MHKNSQKHAKNWTRKKIKLWKLASLLDAIKTVRALFLSSLDSNFDWTEDRRRTVCLVNVSLWLGHVVLRTNDQSAILYVCANEIANHLRCCGTQQTNAPRAQWILPLILKVFRCCSMLSHRFSSAWSKRYKLFNSNLFSFIAENATNMPPLAFIYRAHCIICMGSTGYGSVG